ncbi:MAG: hypothetical protein WA839_01895 [Flavobacteriaceae bacterium]|tara:strand:- start:1364 stop:1558 length:195 start_codon:yes stop_codon:yes gene_type:complete
MEGIKAEYDFIEIKEGRRGVNWGLVKQALNHEGKKSYDIITIKINSTGEEKVYYFDITKFFGKF